MLSEKEKFEKRIHDMADTYIHIIWKVIKDSLEIQNFDYENSGMDYYDIVAKYSKKEIKSVISINDLIGDEVDVYLCIKHGSNQIELYLDTFDNIESAQEAAERLLKEISRYKYVLPTIGD